MSRGLYVGKHLVRLSYQLVLDSEWSYFQQSLKVQEYFIFRSREGLRKHTKNIHINEESAE